mmetsp:Transcript_102758/g.257705  ORF Transcript_102758/g.257705 Transcript_102758/m.257705 type:complete len:347 (+) Transcript_102758:164-1204(+)
MARSVQRVEGGRTRTCAATIVRLDFGVRQVGCGPVVWPGAAIAKMSMPINEIPWQGTSPILPLVQGEDCVGCPVRMHQAEVVVRAASPPRGVASASHRNLVRGRGDSHIRCGDTVPAHHHVGDEPTMRPTEEEDHFTVDVVLRDHPIRDVDDVLVLTRVLVEIEFNTQDGRGEHDAIAVLLECRACCSEQTFTHVTGIVILRSVQRNDQRTLQVHCSAGWRTLNEEGSVDRGWRRRRRGRCRRPHPHGRRWCWRRLRCWSRCKRRWGRCKWLRGRCKRCRCRPGWPYPFGRRWGWRRRRCRSRWGRCRSRRHCGWGGRQRWRCRGRFRFAGQAVEESPHLLPHAIA